jgi:hypothetical protein
MTEPSLIHRQRTLLHDLYHLVAERTQLEPGVEASFQTRQETTEQEFEQARSRILSRCEAEKSSAEREFQQSRSRLTTDFEEEYTAVNTEYAEKRQQINEQYQTDTDAVKDNYREARWTNSAQMEGTKNDAENLFKKVQSRLDTAQRRMQSIRDEATKLLQEWRQPPEPGTLSTAGTSAPSARAAVPKLHRSIRLAERHLGELRALVVPRFVKGQRLFWLSALLWLLLLYPCIVVAGWVGDWWYGLVAATVIAGGTGLGVTLWLKALARTQVREIFQPLCQFLADATACHKRIHDIAARRLRRQLAAAQKRHDRGYRKAQHRYRRGRMATQLRRDTALREIEEKYPPLLAQLEQRIDQDLRHLEEKYRRQLTEIKERCEKDLAQIQEHRQRMLEVGKAEHEQAWQTLLAMWGQGMANLKTAVQEITQESTRLFPQWENPAWNDWSPPSALPSAIRFGQYPVNLAEIPNGVPNHERLRAGMPSGFTLPALLAFPRHCSLLYKASDEGRFAAVQSLQAVMLRFLTSLPPGKVRFTILDPVGLGENFAAFMHLADYDEALVASRIWTEANHIEQRLADLTAHMENVIQKYLRNQFQTIEEYNAHAGEVAEPFRILVVANFPANFTVEATRRLVSIASSGARCGVYTLISVDSKQHLPQGFNLADLEEPSVNLEWQPQRFVWKDPDFGQFPLRLDEPPAPEFCTQLLHVIGTKAKEASRVEVPFEFIAPSPERWWTKSTRLGLDVPLGRAGATKRQHLRLGQGTAQHVLIAGKTGSGKSSLLHALITNMALVYSPEEVELYLVDFKKGVEFKTYATHELPHAPVVAIESEREFGLSVLQRLDTELKHRADRFRDAGAQDLNAYRQAKPETPLPRILLVVDEFQEFFVEDDKLAQEAAQLLDRLVRQGRAFGLHVLLGSQTLGGAYTLARSTIDQMAVRIALQCSEADAHLILSDDNSAARLLSRPGEAIYNDANGLVAGNNPFQVVWLPEERREEYLEQIHRMDRQRYPNVSRPRIVFEGNAPANVGKNHLLNQLLTSAADGVALPSAMPPARGRQAWLGEALAIKDPTAAVFRRESSNNLLLVGQQDEAALGILVTALVSLAAQDRAGDSRFFVLDSSPAGEPHAGLFARLQNVVPQPLRVGGGREVAAILGELTEEVERRSKTPELAAPAFYLFIIGLQRFRDLRKGDDDFGFSRREEKPSPSRQLETLLREGPTLGIHTVLWCDTLNNLNRSLERQALREIAMRVVFQMSAADSSTLIDTPLASKLGLHRALLVNEEEGRLEKFRPYAPPSENWLDWVKQQLATEAKLSEQGVRV